MAWKCSLVQWSQTNNTVDIQREERRLSGLFMRHSKRKQAGRIIWEHCLDNLCHSPLLQLLPLVLLAQSTRSPLWGEPRLGSRSPPAQPHRDLDKDTWLLLQWPEDGARAPESRGSHLPGRGWSIHAAPSNSPNGFLWLDRY